MTGHTDGDGVFKYIRRIFFNVGPNQKARRDEAFHPPKYFDWTITNWAT